MKNLDRTYGLDFSGGCRRQLATQPDSAPLENLAMLADRAVAAEKDVDEAKPGVAESG